MDSQESKPAAARRKQRPKRRRGIAPWHSICEGLLASVVVGSALAIGTVHMLALFVVSALALLGATLEVLALRRVPWPAVALAALGLFSALQAIPLPGAWASRALPVSADIWSHCLVPFGEPALTRFPLSLDAGASIAEALKWTTYACVYILATRMRARRGSDRLAHLLFGSATLVTLITLAHGVANVSVLYGLYEPHFAAGRWNVGPLLNSNNLAGYGLLGLFSGGGLLLSGRSPLPRSLLIVCLAIISAALSLSGSRAAVLSLFIFGAVTVIWLGKGQQSRFWLRTAASSVAPVAIGIAVAIALGTAKEASQFGVADVRRKVSVWLWSLPMIREHVLFGVGRGAFETAFPPYRQALAYDWSIVVTHAENFVVQWIAEWGVPVGSCAVVVIVGYVLREWLGSRTDRLRFMMLTGLVALFVQNLADLGLEIPALAIAAVLALAGGERLRGETSPTSALQNRFGWLAFAALAPAFALWGAAVVWSRFPVDVERRAMSIAYRELAVESPQQRARFRAQLHSAVLRHPGESFFPLLGALSAMRSCDGDPLPWLARSLALAPTSGPVNLVLAQLLHSHGANAQAMLHLRRAALYDRTLAGAVGSRAALWAPSVELLMQAIPEGPYRVDMLLDACAKQPRVESKIDCFRRAVLDNLGSPQLEEQLAESLLSATQTRQPPCGAGQVEGCVAEAEAALKTAMRLAPKSWRPGYLMSKVLLARGDAVGAARLLTRVCPLATEGDPCWREAVQTAIKSGSEEAILTASDAFAARPCDGSEACAEKFDWLASNLEAGNAALANTFFGKAAEADPSASRWIKVAEHATQAHLYGVARSALERADRSPDASVVSRARAELLMQQIARASGVGL